ncbi:MAG: hypothetical protein GY838_00725 [bacterium]|nr:hypothetical protein [bacterium]
MSSSESITGRWLHFAGVGGSGMSALAQFHAQSGGTATGSDRAFDQNERQEIRAALEAQGVTIVPQDGSFPAVHDRSCDALVVSTAVEDRVPDVRAAKAADIGILHRSELLAEYVASHRTVAVSGTSGKSTVTGMVFAILRQAGRAPGLLTGGALTDLRSDVHPGNAWAPGPAADGPPWLVIEADESDGSLVRYRPWLGLVLNLGLDHKEPAVIMDMFRVFRDRAGALVTGADEVLDELGGDRFGLVDEDRDGLSGTFAEEVVLAADHVAFRVGDVPFIVPGPGRHTVLNAAAAIAAGRRCGVALADMPPALRSFGGIARRFDVLGTAGGVEVIDDFAHNPDKIAAAVAAARLRLTGGGRLLAFFQPHGYGPTRFLREALVATFSTCLADDDVLWMPEIFYAGGTVTKDISAGDLIADIADTGRQARFMADRAEIPANMATEAREGDVVLVMGARDPSLTAFGQEILVELETGRG